MSLSEHITAGFDFDEAIALAELCHRARQVFAPGRTDPGARYVALFADQWEFAHAIRAPGDAAQVLILRRAQHNQWAVVLQLGAPPDPAVDATSRSLDGDDEQEIPITNVAPAMLERGEEFQDEEPFKDQFRSVAFPPLPGEVAPPPLGTRVGWAWLRALDGCQAEIVCFFGDQVGVSQGQASAAAPGELEIYITGHGAGGCLATLCALHLKRTWESRIDFPYFSLKMVNFGSPKVGNRAFVDYYNGQMKGFSFRVQNLLDGATYEPTVAAPFPYNLELLLPGVDYVRDGANYYMSYEHIGEVAPLAGVGNAPSSFNLRGPLHSMLVTPFAHGPEGYKQLLLAAQKVQDVYWKPVQQMVEQVEERRKGLMAAFQQQVDKAPQRQAGRMSAEQAH